MAIIKPPVRAIWADSAVSPTDTVDPGNTFIAAGWPSSGTPPSRQRFNFALNYLWNAVRYFSSRGIAAWDAAETYAPGALVLDSNLNLWKCGSGNTGEDPSTSVTGHWVRPTFLTAPFGSNNTDGANTQFVAAAVGNESSLRAAADAATLTAAETFTSGVVGVEASNRAAADAAVLSSANATTAAGLALKANANNAALTGLPTAPTAARGSSTGQVANTAFANPGSFLSVNGFVILSSGLILQWGVITVPNSVNNVIDAVITFPIAFPAQCFGVQVSTTRSVGSNGQAINGSGFSGNFNLATASVSVDSSGGGVSQARWFAVGA